MGQGTKQIATRAEVYNIGKLGTLTESTRCCTYTEAAAFGLPVTGSNKLITYDNVVATTKPFAPYLYMQLFKSGAYNATAYFSGNLSAATWYTTESAASTGTTTLIADNISVNATISSNFPHELNMNWTYNNSRYVITRVYCKTQNWAVGASDTTFNQSVVYGTSTFIQPTIIIKDNNTSKYTGLKYNFYHG